jgi:DNA replication protein DnaC
MIKGYIFFSRGSNFSDNRGSIFIVNQQNEIFSSQLAATAILDRLIHYSHVLVMGNKEMGDDSYRVKGKRKESQL